MTGNELRSLTVRVKRLVRQGRYRLSSHVLHDHPERWITEANILEAIKSGRLASREPREVDGRIRYSGEDRFRWLGADQKDRVLRLIVVITETVVVVSAVKATERQSERYREE